MSAIRCFKAWNEPIGRPNCTRSLLYATVMSSARAASPACRAVTPTAPTSSARSTAAEVSPMGVVEAVLRSTWARRMVWSIDSAQVRVAVSGSTSTKPWSVAATRTVARSPSSTGPPPVTNAAGSPAAIRGSRRRLASSSAPASSASAVTSEDSKGDGARDRPTSSSTIMDSNRVKPAPSYSSGMPSAAAPICSQSVCQSASSYPMSDSMAFRTAAESARFVSSDRTVAASSCCSSENANSISRPAPRGPSHGGVPACPMR